MVSLRGQQEHQEDNVKVTAPLLCRGCPIHQLGYKLYYSQLKSKPVAVIICEISIFFRIVKGKPETLQ